MAEKEKISEGLALTQDPPQMRIPLNSLRGGQVSEHNRVFQQANSHLPDPG